MSVTVPTVTLNNGQKQPIIGFGLWKVDPSEATDVVYNAIKLGYRMLDGAAVYGNEKQVGEGIARAIKEGIVTRSELFVVSKLWTTFHEPQHVKPALQRTLSDLGLDYVDLYYVHFPYPIGYVDPAKRYPNDWMDEYHRGDTPLHVTWHAMEALQKEGLTKGIAVSNYSGAVFADLLRYAKIKPAALQIEHHPYLVQPSLVKFAQDEGIQVTAYSSFGPTSFVELDLPRAKDAQPLFDVDVVKAVAEKHGRGPSEVLLRWSTQRGIAVIPKSANPGRAKQNLSSLGFDLTEDELKQISALDKNLRFNDPLDDNVPMYVFS